MKMLSTYKRAGKTPLAAAISLAILGSSQSFAQATIEEIIVTAQKQMETLQDVPIAVTAFSENDLSNLGAQDVADVAKFAPNVSVSEGATQPSYTIRGIGTSDFGVGADPAVGVYIDGVYVGRSGASKVAFNDIERVEILNGPQGTLFGRNAAAGAIQYITNKPVSETQGWVRGTVGNYEKKKLEGVYNTALADNLNWRIGALWNEREGDVDNLYDGETLNGEDNKSVTTSFAFYPIDAIEMIWRLEYDKLDPGARAQNSATVGLRDGSGSDFDEVENDGNTFQSRELFGTSLHVDWELDAGVASSITAYRTFNSTYREERDGSADPLFRLEDQNDEDNASWSQELRFSSANDGWFNYTVGMNYSTEDAKQTSSVYFNPIAIDKYIVETEGGVPYSLIQGLGLEGIGLDTAFNTPFASGGFAEFDRIYPNGTAAVAADEFDEHISVAGDYTSLAAFGDFVFSVHEDVDVTLGVRWTRDEKEFSRFVEYNDFGMGVAFPNQTVIDASGNLATNPDGSLNPFGGAVGWYTQEESWEEVTPRAVVDYRLTEDVLTYVSYSEGYKAGGFNSAGEIEAEAFDPEAVTNYEVGMKSSWFDYTLRVNAAYFWYDYENLQALELVPSECSGGGTDTYQFRTSDVEGQGFELGAIWIPVDNLTLSFNTGTIDSEYTRRIDQFPREGQCVTEDKSGEKRTESPDLLYSMGINYMIPMASGAELSFNAAYNFAEGADRDSCKYLDENADGSVNVYQLETIDNQLQITSGGYGDPSPLAAAPISNCAASPDQQLLNLRVAYLAASGNWEFAGYVLNATDEDGDQLDPGGLGGSLKTDYSDGSPTFSREDPRLYGVEVKYMF